MSRIVDVEPLDCLAWKDGEHGTTFDDGVLWVLEKIGELPTAPTCDDAVSRQAAINAVLRAEALVRAYGYRYAADAVRELPPVQPEKETARRVLWTGWKGARDTRYKCPNCKKPVKNDDVYCHRCGQKLMFPHISFTDYVPGEKQETIVRWDDE